MRICSVQVENFGCIANAKVQFDSYSALIGPNNSGKSTILSAIEKFFSTTPKIERKHFFRHEEDRVISITICFGDLTPDERQAFGSAVIDEKMTVTRSFGGGFGLTGIYSVVANANPAFAAFREEQNGTTRRQIYAGLRGEFHFDAASGDAMEENLKAWEAENPGQLEKVRMRGFFGAVNVANGMLKKKTSLRFVQAVPDLTEVTSSKASPIIELLQDIRRQTLQNQQEFNDLIAEANSRINEYVEGSDSQSLSSIGDTITSLLQKYYSDTRVETDLPPPHEIEVSFPSPSLRVVHRELSGGLDNVGHGLQRAVLFSVVQFLAQHLLTTPQEDEEPKKFDEAASDIIVLIEEPESYQHPQKQRIIRDVLQEITRTFDHTTGIRLQVLICTHSEKFIRIRDLDSVRLVSTSFVDGEYETRIRSMTLEKLRDQIFQARGRLGAVMSLSTFAAGMHVFSDAISEGFFAEKIVLLEGVGDAAAIEGAFISAGVDYQQLGISIISVDGKTKLDKPLQTFRFLEIPVYCVFDSDAAKGDAQSNKKYNRLLQSICDVGEPEDHPAGVFSDFASFKGNLDSYLKERAGEQFDECRMQVANSLGLDRDDVGKSPAAISSFLQIARSMNCTFPMLDEIVDRVRAL